MNLNFEIEALDKSISNYELILSRFDSWKDSKREIILNQILNSEKKLEFLVEIDNTQRVFYVESKQGDIFRYKSAVIKFIKFIIKDNKVIKLTVGVETLRSGYGLYLEELINSGYELKLHEECDVKGNILNFYFIIPNQAA